MWFPSQPLDPHGQPIAYLAKQFDPIAQRCPPHYVLLYCYWVKKLSFNILKGPHHYLYSILM